MKALVSSLACLTLLTASSAKGQVTADTARRSALVTINPLGLLQFGPNLEFELVPQNMMGLSLGVRVASFGLIPHLIAAADDEDLEFTWTGTAAWRFYPGSRAPGGFFVGPRVELGKGGSTGTDDFGNPAEWRSTVYVAAADYGYRWIKPSGFTLSVGAQTGAIVDDWKNTANAADSGTDFYPFFMFVLWVGVAF